MVIQDFAQNITQQQHSKNAEAAIKTKLYVYNLYVLTAKKSKYKKSIHFLACTKNLHSQLMNLRRIKGTWTNLGSMHLDTVQLAPPGCLQQV